MTAHLDLITLTTPNNTYRYVNNTENVSHGGFTFLPFPLSVALGGQPSQGFAPLSLSFANAILPTGGSFGTLIEANIDDFIGATVKHELITGSLVLHTTTYTVNSINIAADAIAMTGGLKSLYNRGLFKHRYTGSSAPGLF